jgi:hypothetical protein
LCTKTKNQRVTFTLSEFISALKAKTESKANRMNVLYFTIQNENKSYVLISLILISLFILFKLMKSNKGKKEESKSTLLLTIVSVLITMVLFYIF